MSEIRITLEGRDLAEVEAEAAERGVSKAEALRSMLRELAVYRRMSGGFTAESRRFGGVAPQTAPSPSLPGPPSSPPPSPEPLSPPSLSPPDPLTHTRVCEQDEIEKEQVGALPGFLLAEQRPAERSRDELSVPVHPAFEKCMDLPEPLLFPGAGPVKRSKPAKAAKPKPLKLGPRVTLEQVLTQVPEFCELCDNHPRRDSLLDAFKAYQQTEGIRPPHALLLSALRRQVAGRWAGLEKVKIPLLATWLRNQRWNDEPGGGAVVPMPAAARASPGVDLPALKRAVQAEVGGALGGRVSREELAEILDEMETINDEPSLRRWAEEAVRR